MAIWNHMKNEPVRHSREGVDISEISPSISCISKLYRDHYNAVLRVLAINNTVNGIRFNPDEMVVFKHFIIKGLIEGNSPEETANVITNHPLAKS
tara:strand:- start:323 stop:607 length:285 start_codon:yes stop_codon:yes gene_type:complete